MSTTIATTIETLTNNASRLVKEDTLKKNRDNATLQRFFKLCLEPRINFFIKKIPTYTPSNDSDTTLDVAMDLLSTLSNREVTGNEAITFLQDLLCSVDKTTASLIVKIINKNPQCGVSVSTVNKIWPNLITDIPYMRCSLPTDELLSGIDWDAGVYSQLKADGMFVNVNVNEHGTVTAHTRNGVPFPMTELQPLVNSLSKSTSARGQQLHGELLVKLGDILPRTTSNGMLNSILHGGSLPDRDYQFVYEVWDTIPIGEARAKNKYTVPYTTRFDLVNKIVGECGDGVVTVIENRLVHSYSAAYDHFREMRNAGKEGTVIKLSSTIWEDTTSKRQIKMKAEVEVDLRIIGFNDAALTSKNRNTFGSIALGTDDNLLLVNATGISDKMRQVMHDTREQLVGKIVTVCVNDLMMPSKTNPQYSLFLPRIVEIREDKTTTDNVPDIMRMFESVMN